MLKIDNSALRGRENKKYNEDESRASMSKDLPRQDAKGNGSKGNTWNFATDWESDESMNPRKGQREGELGVQGYVPPIGMFQLLYKVVRLTVSPQCGRQSGTFTCIGENE